jgi:hypothetical protein
MLTTFFHDAWHILVWSLILGAGLPVIYAIGILCLSIGSPAAATASGADVQPPSRNPLGVALASICFLIVVAGVATGLLYVIAAGHGKQLSFDNGYPTIVAKS